MDNQKIKSAQTVIKIAVVLRLLVIALLALMLAYAYSDEQENIVRMYHENSSLGYIVPGFFLDMVLTVIWLYRPKLHTLHLVSYILLGGYFYLFYVLDVLNLYGMGALVAFLIVPVIWLTGLIPFIVCGIGRNKLTKAKSAEDSYKMGISIKRKPPLP